MSSFKKGGIFILSSPSGAGKTTLVKKYLKIEIFQFQYLIQQDRQDQMRKMEKTIFLYQNNFKNLLKRANS